MKGNYITPELKIVTLQTQDVVTASQVDGFNLSWIGGGEEQ